MSNMFVIQLVTLILLSLNQLFFCQTIELYCPAGCDDSPPNSPQNLTCDQIRLKGGCGKKETKGFCECSCRTCPISAFEGYDPTNPFGNLPTNSSNKLDVEIVANETSSSFERIPVQNGDRPGRNSSSVQQSQLSLNETVVDSNVNENQTMVDSVLSIRTQTAEDPDVISSNGQSPDPSLELLYQLTRNDPQEEEEDNQQPDFMSELLELVLANQTWTHNQIALQDRQINDSLTLDNFEELPEAGEVGCDCYDDPPIGSTYTCMEMFLDDKCIVLLEYGFCECTCGKCGREGELSVQTPNVAFDGTPNNPAIAPLPLSIPQSNEVYDPTKPVSVSSTSVTFQEASVRQTSTPSRIVPSPQIGTVSPLVRVAPITSAPPSERVSPTSVGIVTSPTLPTQISFDAVVQVCRDVEPPQSQLSCPEWKLSGSCVSLSVQGYCELSCGVCADEDIVADSVPSPISTMALEEEQELSQNSMCLSACNDNPPPKSDYTCAQQRTMGKCSRAWMKGYCECTCKSCDALSHMNDFLQDREAIEEEQLVIPSPSYLPTNNYEDGDFILTVLHFNDLHARIEPVTEWWWECEPWRNENGECFGGFARMKTVIDLERKDDPDLLLLNGGDDFVGSLWDYHDPTNKATAYLQSQMGVDAMALGNHEFDHGPDKLIEYVKEAKYAVLSCNMDASKKPSLEQITSKYTIKVVKGRRIGIFGLTTDYTNVAEAANPYPVWFEEPYEAARKCVRELQSQNVDIIIALSHLGYSADTYLVREVSGVDLVVGAHSHSFLSHIGDKGPELNRYEGTRDTSWGPYPTWVKAPDGQSIPVVQAGWATRYLGKIQLQFNEKGEIQAAWGQPILLGGSASSNDVAEDQQFVQEIKNRKWWR
eukprot:TRINITY_DN3933_c0_g1_i3.p1 TRINITY_DN3933_c0_g1~~TRINITY_DN3933_c0_g1_i3.p1  ORF type:complete len:877 (+),score=140.15 TRINITY_DN3933_c0_g1_i3:196-2826(+)